MSSLDFETFEITQGDVINRPKTTERESLKDKNKVWAVTAIIFVCLSPNVYDNI